MGLIQESAGGLLLCSTLLSVTKLSTDIPNKSLHPYFVTGFSDAESSFCVKVVKDKKSKLGYSVKLVFQIGLLLLLCFFLAPPAKQPPFFSTNIYIYIYGKVGGGCFAG